MHKYVVYTLLIIVGFYLMGCRETQKKESPKSPSRLEQKTAPNRSGNSRTDDKTPPNVANERIPPKVYKILQYVRENGQPMSGYVGGRNFQNRERRLAIKDASGNKIKYQEWDVNPKRGGVNRGVERLVTGSDNRAWYTNDHYQTFVEVQ